LGDATSISNNLSPSLLIGGAYSVARNITVAAATAPPAASIPSAAARQAPRRSPGRSP
jgi:hypothetical protein